MNAQLRTRLLHTAAALTLVGAGSYAAWEAGERPGAAIALAMDIGSYYESGGRHIGTPYRDKIGKGQPWTVCAGVTGPQVNPSHYYTPEECQQLELPKYREAERQAQAALRYWNAYNVWVRASFIDMVYNVGPGALHGTTIARLANAGDLDGACAQMTRWVYGTVNGQRVPLAGLQARRDATRELCAEWGRDGHFSAGLAEGDQP